MIGPILAWWVATTVAGAAAFPIAWRFFHRLPDRGLGVTRAFGVLLAGYLLWAGATLGWIRNSPSGAVGALILVGLAGILAGRGRWGEIGRWLLSHWKTVAVMEALFLGAFVGWAVVRAFNPEIVATEKPMELAFLNAILRSPQFPPQDPWLSGNAISYYYLGYVVLALLTQLTGVVSGVAFNLGNALSFALVVVGSYAVVFDLLGLAGKTPRRLAAGLGPLFVVLTGNLGGLLEVLHSLHFGWSSLADGTMVSRFWTWLNLQDLVAPPAGPPAFPPARFWWWWQASRVVNDIDLAGRHVEVIDEFPFFSYLLADNHPHVLALPFAILAILVALQVLAAGRDGGFRLNWVHLSDRAAGRWLWIAIGAGIAFAAARPVAAFASGVPFPDALSGAARGAALAAVGIVALVALAAVASGRTTSLFSGGELIFVAWLSGVLAFLNTWDLPIYLSLILAAAVWGMRRSPVSEWMRALLASGLATATLAVLAVLPWLPTFSSQAGGVLPNLVFPTRLPQFLIMFLVVLFPVAVWLVWQVRAEFREGRARRTIAAITLGTPLLLLLISWALAGLVVLAAPEVIQDAVRSVGATSTQEVAAVALARRLSSPWVPLLLAFLLSLVWLFLRKRFVRTTQANETPASDVFVAMMAGFGALLVLFPDFAYLKDSFGTRMNTVFKFYYAAWLLWGLAAAYGLARLWDARGRRTGWLAGLAALPLLFGLVYTTTALWDKTSHFHPPVAPTLDGTAHLEVDDAPDAAAMHWMVGALEPGVVAEAVGGSYTAYGRVSANTGFPTVLGWDFHEYQWRGSFTPQGTRKEDIDRLYTTRDWTEAHDILDRYGVDYVYVGPLETSTYPGLVTRKFDVNMDRVYESDGVTIYRRRTGAGL
jgi:uncharacterized membrane protein